MFYKLVARAGVVMLLAAYFFELVGSTFGPSHYVNIGRILFIIACCDFLIALFSAPREGVRKGDLIVDALAIVVGIVASFFVYLVVASIPVWAGVRQILDRGRRLGSSSAVETAP